MGETKHNDEDQKSINIKKGLKKRFPDGRFGKNNPNFKYDIDIKKCIFLYDICHKNSTEIAKELKCTKYCILKVLHDNNIKVRNSKGKNNGMYGKHHTLEHKKHISNINKGPLNAFYGKKHTKETLEKLRGKNSHQWKGGISTENNIIRKRPEYLEWRTNVYKRDNYTCVVSGKKSGKLVVHHLDSFAKFPERRFDIENGVTLSKEMHNKFHKQYGTHNNTKIQFIDFKERLGDL